MFLRSRPRQSDCTPQSLMRIPVFARGANPSIDRFILKKSVAYVEQQVEEGRADWVDVADPRKGIICRELLYFGERRQFQPEPVKRGVLPPIEAPGTKFISPRTALELAFVRAGLLVKARMWAKAATVKC